MTGEDALTRGDFLRRTGAIGVAVAGGTLWATAPAAARARRYGRAQTPLRHVVISCQENRSFDHYYGYASQVQARGLGPPPGYTQPDAAGVGHAPFELTALRSTDPPHGWTDVHAQWNQGAMDGFYKTAQLRTGDGNNAIPYYTAKELPYYYSLFDDQAALCGNYFCSLLGPTWPNRFYLMSGTSGGITTNGLWGYGIFDSTSWPIILDLLDDAGVTWKSLIGSDGVEVDDTDNVAVFWSSRAHDERHDGHARRLSRGLPEPAAPECSWIIPSYSMQFERSTPTPTYGWDGLPAADHHDAEASRTRASRRCSHVRLARRLLRPRRAAAGRRVRTRHPGAAIGHLAPREARRRHVSKPTIHVSTLKFIERLWATPDARIALHGFDVYSTGPDYDTVAHPHTARPPRLVERSSSTCSTLEQSVRVTRTPLSTSRSLSPHARLHRIALHAFQACTDLSQVGVLQDPHGVIRQRMR